MARHAILDYLQNHAFFLMDLAPIGAASMPLFMPLSGFSSITAPEIKVETETVKESNWFYPTYVVKSASVGPIRLQRGSTLANSDFERWINNAIKGDTRAFTTPSLGGLLPTISITSGGPTFRRKLMLIQFFPRWPLPGGIDGLDPSARALLGEGVLAAAAVAGAATGGGGLGGAVIAGAAAVVGGGLEMLLSGEVPDYALRLPAKAWILYDCIPTRYKVSGEFNAGSAEISIQELELQPSYIEEISLMG
jgi:hypothetical protein